MGVLPLEKAFLFLSNSAVDDSPPKKWFLRPLDQEGKGLEIVVKPHNFLFQGYLPLDGLERVQYVVVGHGLHGFQRGSLFLKGDFQV